MLVSEKRKSSRNPSNLLWEGKLYKRTFCWKVIAQIQQHKQAHHKKTWKIPRLDWIFDKIEFPLLFLFLFCPKINIIEIQRSVSEKSSDWALKNWKIWKLLTTPRYERSHLAEFSHQQLSQPTVTDVNKICWKYFNRQNNK